LARQLLRCGAPRPKESFLDQDICLDRKVAQTKKYF
jgi:hypothetical protein